MDADFQMRSFIRIALVLWLSTAINGILHYLIVSGNEFQFGRFDRMSFLQINLIIVDYCP
jgi:hypothetical protein